MTQAQAPGTVGDILSRFRVGKDSEEESIGGPLLARTYLVVPSL